MLIRDIVYSLFRKVADDQGRTLAPLSDNLRLSDSGLDSLSFAIVVTSLEDELNADPFGDGATVNFPATLGEFIHLYERAVAN